jgi:hypothetical protein
MKKFGSRTLVRPFCRLAVGFEMRAVDHETIGRFIIGNQEHDGIMQSPGAFQ